MIRFKESNMMEQQEATLLEKAMDHLCARCDEDAAFTLMGKVNDRIEYIRRTAEAFKGLYGRAN